MKRGLRHLTTKKTVTHLLAHAHLVVAVCVCVCVCVIETLPVQQHPYQ